MDLTRLPPADRWRLLTLYAHLEEYERTACRIVEQSAALLAQVMQTPRRTVCCGSVWNRHGEHPPSYERLCPVPDAVRPEHHLSAPASCPSTPCFLTGDDHITVIAGVLYWPILRLTEKYAANDEHLLACLKTRGDKSRLIS